MKNQHISLKLLLAFWLHVCIPEKKNQPKTMASSWWFQPMSFEKYAGQIGSSPQVRMKTKNLWNHNPGVLWDEFREPRFHRFPAKGAFDGVEEPENWSRQPLEPTWADHLPTKTWHDITLPARKAPGWLEDGPFFRCYVNFSECNLRHKIML